METDYRDYQQVYSDNFDHAFTSESSLRVYAKYLRLGGRDLPKDEVDEAIMWLQTHSDEIPGELYDRDGLPRFNKAEYPQSATTNYSNDGETYWAGFENMRKEDARIADAVLQSTDGMYYVGEQQCNQSLASYARSIAATDPEYKELLGSEGPYAEATRYEALAKRGESYRKHKEAQDKRLRWQGMEEYDAVAKADEKLAEGLDRTPDSSNAKPLPCVGRLHELFELRDGVLFNRRLGRAISGRKVKVDGKLYVPSRIAFALETGEDPADRMVRDGNASHYRKAEGNVIARATADEDVFRWDSRVLLGKEVVTVGQYRTEAQAKEACRLYLKSLDMGL